MAILVHDVELGQGQTGTLVHLCKDEDTQELYACKSIMKVNNSQEEVRQEIAIMRHLPNHPNIVSLQKASETKSAVHLFMELCRGGELFDRINAKGRYKEREAKPLMRTIMQVVQTCHQHGVMHRDLKPENILFVNKKEDSPLKVIDFGMAVFFKPGEKFTEVVGTAYYMAPEIFQRRGYGPEVDVWSAGVILYLLLSGEFPFAEKAGNWATWDLETGPWKKVYDSAKSLVRHMLDPNPEARYNAEQVLSHPWLQKSKVSSYMQFFKSLACRS